MNLKHFARLIIVSEFFFLSMTPVFANEQDLCQLIKNTPADKLNWFKPSDVDKVKLANLLEKIRDDLPEPTDYIAAVYTLDIDADGKQDKLVISVTGSAHVEEVSVFDLGFHRKLFDRPASTHNNKVEDYAEDYDTGAQFLAFENKIYLVTDIAVKKYVGNQIITVCNNGLQSSIVEKANELTGLMNQLSPQAQATYKVLSKAADEFFASQAAFDFQFAQVFNAEQVSLEEQINSYSQNFNYQIKNAKTLPIPEKTIAYKEADEQLNQVYGLLVKKLNDALVPHNSQSQTLITESKSLLKKSEIKWLKYRDAWYDYYTIVNPDFVAKNHLDNKFFKINSTLSRTAELKQYLNEVYTIKK